MQDLSLHLLDLADNAIAARATRLRIAVREDRRAGRLYIDIEDDGSGMDEMTLEQALDPFFTTKEGRQTGMGLALFRQAARESGGELRIESHPGRGTKIRAVFGLDHPDRKPMGNIQETLRLLRVSHPEIDITWEHQIVDGEAAHEAQT